MAAIAPLGKSRYCTLTRAQNYLLPSDDMLPPMSPIKTDVEHAFKKRKLLEMAKEPAAFPEELPMIAALQGHPSQDRKPKDAIAKTQTNSKAEGQSTYPAALPSHRQRSDAKQSDDGYR